MKVPNFLLKKLYQKGSLANAGGGCRFTLINPFAFDLVIGGRPLVIDGRDVAVEAVSFYNGEQTMNAAELSPTHYFKFLQKTPIEVRIAGHELSPGPHRLVLRVKLKGAGDFEFTFDDRI